MKKHYIDNLMKINNHIKICLLLLIIFFLLEYIYSSYIVKYFLSDGYRIEFNLIKYIETKVLFCLVLFFLFYKKISPFIYAIINLVILFFFIPNLIIYEFMDSDFIIIYSVLFMIICLLFLNIDFFKNFYLNINFSLKILILGLLIFLFFLPFFLKFGAKINLNVFIFQDIYKVRTETELSTGGLGYLYHWLAKVLCPVMIIIGLNHKRYLLIIFSTFVMLYLFGIAGHKSVFFSIFVVLLFYHGSYYTKIKYLNLVFILLIAVGYLMFFYFNLHVGLSVTVRRIFFDPALGNVHYFNFFNNNSIFYSQSFLKSFFLYPYPITPEQIISIEYFNMPLGSANNGIISDGYMNLSYLGVFFNVILFSFLFKFFENINISHHFFGLYVIVVFTFVSSFFFTSLVTHGIFLLILVLLLLKNKN